ncbi:MAG: type I-E CRISPR-associated protein Cse2/CasB [Thermoguttaceae bacterium]|nr:type I-E CRISPR-associated protein Cse2/CasB [Thermoguttaceae bacterium]
MNSNSESLFARCLKFVRRVMRKIVPPDKKKSDTAFRAEMTRASNPQTEYQAYKHLARLGVRLDREVDRRAFGLIGAAIAHHRIGTNGNQRFGQAMRTASLMDSGELESAGERRMERILACSNTLELIDVLRPVLRFILQNEKVSLNFASLLKEIILFDRDEYIQEIKIHWAQDFYKGPSKKSEDSGEDSEKDSDEEEEA